MGNILASVDLHEINWISIILRVTLSMLIGGTIGIERGIKRHPAGFRTYMLVCMGAAMVMMTNQYIVEVYGVSDPARLGAQVISGIGFLGAGTIIVTTRNQVRGLTTAASLWMAACLGLAIGIGFYEGAVIGGIMVLMIMTVFQRFDNWVAANNRFLKICVTFNRIADFEDFEIQCEKLDIKIKNIELSAGKVSKTDGVVAVMVLETARRGNHEDILQQLSEFEGVRHIEEL